MSEGGCMACRANRGELHPPGGVIYDDGLWRLEHMLMPAVLPGWLILRRNSPQPSHHAVERP
jgi:hypothetical protein